MKQGTVSDAPGGAAVTTIILHADETEFVIDQDTEIGFDPIDVAAGDRICGTKGVQEREAAIDIYPVYDTTSEPVVNAMVGPALSK